MIDEQDYDYELTHRYGGNGWAVLQDVGNDSVRIVSVGRNGLGDWTPVAWRKFLSKSAKSYKDEQGRVITEFKPLPDHIKAMIQAARSQIKA